MRLVVNVSELQTETNSCYTHSSKFQLLRHRAVSLCIIISGPKK